MFEVHTTVDVKTYLTRGGFHVTPTTRAANPEFVRFSTREEAERVRLEYVHPAHLDRFVVEEVK